MMHVRHVCALLLCLLASSARATTGELAFIGPALAGVYQIQDGQAQGELVGILQQLGSLAGIHWRYQLATPARVEVTLAGPASVCSLHLQSPHQPGDYQILGLLGQHAIVAYSGLHDSIALHELARLPDVQRLGFGTGLKTLLQTQYRLDVIEHPSLATAVQLVTLGRARVLITTQISMYSLQPAPLLRRIGTLGKADNVLACSRQLPPALASRLRQGLHQLLIPFTL